MRGRRVLWLFYIIVGMYIIFAELPENSALF